MSTDFRLNSIFLPLSEVSISPQTGRALMSLRSDRISQILSKCLSTLVSLSLSLPRYSPCSFLRHLYPEPAQKLCHARFCFVSAFLYWIFCCFSRPRLIYAHLHMSLYITGPLVLYAISHIRIHQAMKYCGSYSLSLSLSPALSWSICLSCSFDGSPTWHDKFHARYYRRGHTMAKADTKFIAHPGP